MKSKKNKATVEARRSHTSMVLEARQAAVKLTKELHNTMAALRHSNAIGVYLLQMMLDKAPEHDNSFGIPLDEYKKLQADDTTTVKIEYTETEARIRLERPTFALKSVPVQP